MTETTEEIQSEENQTPLAEIGQLLQEAREKKQLSLQEVAEKTRIHLKILQNIEDGKLDSSPGPVFIRGFMRTYGKFVDVELDGFLEKLNAVTELQESDTLNESSVLLFPEEETSFFQEQKLFLILLAMVILGGGYFLIQQLSSEIFGENQTAVPSSMQESISENSPNAAEPQANLSPQPVAETVSAQAPSQTVETQEEKPVAAPASDGEADTVAAVEQSPQEPENIAESDLLALTIKATLASWVAITVDDAAPLEVFLQPGEEYSLEAEERYLLTIGNTKGVELFLNGNLQPVETKEELLENWVIDKSTLTLE